MISLSVYFCTFYINCLFDTLWLHSCLGCFYTAVNSVKFDPGSAEDGESSWTKQWLAMKRSTVSTGCLACWPPEAHSDLPVMFHDDDHRGVTGTHGNTQVNMLSSFRVSCSYSDNNFCRVICVCLCDRQGLWGRWWFPVMQKAGRGVYMCGVGSKYAEMNGGLETE